MLSRSKTTAIPSGTYLNYFLIGRGEYVYNIHIIFTYEPGEAEAVADTTEEGGHQGLTSKTRNAGTTSQHNLEPTDSTAGT